MDPAPRGGGCRKCRRLRFTTRRATTTRPEASIARASARRGTVARRVRGSPSAEERERIESTAVAEVMPTISYQPLSDDEDSEDDELMKRLLKKYGVSAPKGL